MQHVGAVRQNSSGHGGQLKRTASNPTGSWGVLFYAIWFCWKFIDITVYAWYVTKAWFFCFDVWIVDDPVVALYSLTVDKWRKRMYTLISNTRRTPVIVLCAYWILILFLAHEWYIWTYDAGRGTRGSKFELEEFKMKGISMNAFHESHWSWYCVTDSAIPPYCSFSEFLMCGNRTPCYYYLVTPH